MLPSRFRLSLKYFPFLDTVMKSLSWMTRLLWFPVGIVKNFDEHSYFPRFTLVLMTVPSCSWGWNWSFCGVVLLLFLRKRHLNALSDMFQNQSWVILGLESFCPLFWCGNIDAKMESSPFLNEVGCIMSPKTPVSAFGRQQHFKLFPPTKCCSWDIFAWLKNTREWDPKNKEEVSFVFLESRTTHENLTVTGCKAREILPEIEPSSARSACANSIRVPFPGLQCALFRCRQFSTLLPSNLIGHQKKVILCFGRPLLYIA